MVKEGRLFQAEETAGTQDCWWGGRSMVLGRRASSVGRGVKRHRTGLGGQPEVKPEHGFGGV